MICSFETVARPALNLSAPALRAVAANHGTLTVAHAVESLRQLYPGLKMGLTDAADARHGWIEPSGRSVVNLRHAGLDTPFHEAGHLWEAVVENTLPAPQYDAMLDELADSPYHERARQRYPELDRRQQLREGLVQLLGEQAAAEFARPTRLGPGQGQMSPGQGLAALARRFWARLRPALDPLLGPRGREEPPLVLRSLGDVLSQGVEALVRTPSPYLVPKLAAQLLRGTLDQRGATAPSIQNPQHLLEFISGQDASTSVRHLETRAKGLLAKARSRKGALYFELDAESGLGRKQKYAIKGKTEAEQLAAVTETLTKIGQAHRQQLTTDALDFFQRPEAERARLLRGDFGRESELVLNGGFDLSEEQREQRRLYYQEMQNLFPSFQPGDEVLLYTPANAGDLYNPAVDSGSLMLHRQKTKDPATGQEKTVLALASLTDGPLGETVKHRSFLAGIYDSRGLSGVFNNLAVRFGHEVKLSNTHENRQKMQVLLAAMHLKKLGYEVAALSVGKFNPQRARENQVMRLFPTEHLQVIDKLGRLPAVRQALQASGEQGQYLLGLLDEPGLRNPNHYCQDYLSFLSQHYQQAGPNPQAIRGALGEYYQQKSAASVLALDQAIRRRQRQLIRQSNFAGDQNPEFVMLGQALVELAGIKYHLNPWHVIDAATEKFTSFLRNDNPIIQYFVKRWDDTWYNVSQQFMGLQDEHQRVTAALHQDYQSRHSLVAAREHLAEASQAKYYEDLFQKQTVPFVNKDGQLEQREINSHRLILPASAEFKSLSGAQQAYVRWALKAVKERVTAVERMKREQSGQDLKAGELEQWYQEHWGDGRIPVIQAGVWQSVLKGDLAYATEEHLRGLLEDNPRFHDQQQDHEDRLNDYILTQSNDDVRHKLLGLEPDDEDSKKLQLRAADGEQVQNRIEGDLRRTMNVVLMQTLKHEYQQGLEVDQKVGIALIRHHEHITGLLRHSGQVSVGAEGETTSQTEQLFLKMSRQLWLGRKNQGMGHGLEKALYTALSAAGSLATSTILLANVMVPVQSFLSQTLGTLLPQALARQGFEGPGAAPTAAHVAAAIKEVATPANWPKLEALAAQLGVVRHGEYDLLGMRQHTGEPFRIFSGETFYSLDRWGETATRMAVLVAMLKQQGIYDCYQFESEAQGGGRLTYDVARDRQVRGNQVVDTLRDNLVKEGVLKAGEPLDRAYDGRLRRTLEMVMVDVMGGYSPLGQTVLGATAGGNIVRRLAGFLPARVERAMQGRHQSENRGDYDQQSGEWVPEEEVGQAQSWAKLISLMWTQSGGLLSRYQAVKSGGDLSAADKLNLRTLNANFALAAMFATASYAATAAWAEENKRRKRSVALRLLDSLISETFAFENFRMLLGKAASPVIELAMMKNLMDGVSNIIMPGGDATRGWHQIGSRVGALRTLDMVTGAGQDGAAKAAR